MNHIRKPRFEHHGEKMGAKLYDVENALTLETVCVVGSYTSRRGATYHTNPFAASTQWFVVRPDGKRINGFPSWQAAVASLD